MTIDEIVKYVITTPENSNPSVLRSMLEQLGAASGGNTGGDQYCEVLELSPTDFTSYNPSDEPVA